MIYSIKLVRGSNTLSQKPNLSSHLCSSIRTCSNVKFEVLSVHYSNFKIGLKYKQIYIKGRMLGTYIFFYFTSICYLQKSNF